MSSNPKTKNPSRDTLWSVEPLPAAGLPPESEVLRWLETEAQKLAELTNRLTGRVKSERIIR